MDPFSPRVLLFGQRIWWYISIDAGNVAVSRYACLLMGWPSLYAISHGFRCFVTEIVSGGMNQLTGIPPATFPPTLSTFHLWRLSCIILAFSLTRSTLSLYSSIWLSCQCLFGWNTCWTVFYVSANGWVLYYFCELGLKDAAFAFSLLSTSLFWNHRVLVASKKSSWRNDPITW